MQFRENTIFMLPGPVKMHPRVLRAMTTSAIGHRTKEFRQMLSEIRSLLEYMFQSSCGKVALITGSGTAGLDAVFSSFLKSSDNVLALHNGKFGERLANMANFYSNSSSIDFGWGKSIECDKVKEALETDKYNVIVLCHNETSTGMTNNPEKISTLAKQYDCYFILDCITSAGNLQLKLDAWNVDCAIMGSQKCIAAPAGLSAVWVSERAYKRLVPRSYYLDLKKHIDALYNKNDTPYTSAIPLVLAMHEALLMLKEETIEKRIQRIELLGKASRKAALRLALQLFPEKDYSNTLTAIKYPENVKDDVFRSKLLNDLNVVIAGAQEPYKGKFFRIGHMGICELTDLISCYAAIDIVLNKLGFECSGACEEIIYLVK